MADHLAVQSRSQEAEIQFVVAYWIRTLLSSRNIPIKELAALVMKLYPSVLEWDDKRCAPALTISNNNKTVSVSASIVDSDWKSVFAKHVIERRNKTIRWEVTMKHMGDDGEGWMQMGIMDADYIDTADTSKPIGDQNHQSGFFISDTGKPCRFINGSAMSKWNSAVSKWDGAGFEAIHWYIGGRAKLEIKNGRCLAYCNDKLLGNLTVDELPERFYFAISLIEENTAFETTLFEIIDD